MELRVWRGLSVVDKFKIDEQTIFVQRFLGENIIKAETTVRKKLNIAIGDYVRHNGINYYINTLPSVFKNSTNQFVYSITFESVYYNFGKIQYQSSGTGGTGTFYLMNNLSGFVDLLVANLNRVDSGWSKGTTTQTNTEYKLLRFDAETCRSVIQRLCVEFNGEFSFARKVISFLDLAEHDTELTFQYKSGLYNIQRMPVETTNLITRLYAYGSTRNIDSTTYGKLRLELNTGGVNYIESNKALYGFIEGTVIFEDVFPRRTGTVSAVAGADSNGNYVFTDSAIDFDVNTYLISGTTAKVNFLTGNCGGYTFDVSTFVNATKVFTIIPAQLEDGSQMPNVTLHPEINDKYVLIDITMPASYITAAEAELLALAQTHIAKYDHPRVTYKLTPDWRYLKTNNVNLTIGDNVTIVDADLGVDSKVRIIELSQQLIEPYKYNITVSDQKEPQFIYKAFGEVQEVSRSVYGSKVLSDVNRSRRAWRDSEELRSMVFDPDGNFSDSKFTASIAPLSITTLMLQAGSKSQYFQLSGVVFKPNYSGNNNKLKITGGFLAHFAIDTSGADNVGVWTLQANDTYESGGLTTGTAYYLYAKCNKTDYVDAANQVLVSATQYQVDQTTFWYFLVGILHSTTGSIPRGLSLTYGQTLINGGFITTGKIQSASGLTYFDLDGNQIVIVGGTSGGWVIAADSMKDAAGTVGMSSAVTGGDDVRFWAGHTTPASAPFRVTESGALVATSATITGVVTVQAGSNVEVGADVTSTHTAAAITGQGDLATLSIVEAAKLGTTVISGGYIITSLLTANNIQAGTLTGRTVQTAATGARTQLFPDANTGLVIYDNGGAKVFESLVGGTDVGDVIIGDYASNKGLKYDKSAGTFNIKGIVTVAAGSNVEVGADVTSTHTAAAITGQGSLAVLSVIGNAYITDLNVDKLVAGTISSKSIVLAITAGTGDTEIRAGIATGDFANAGAASGFIIGLDDSDSDKSKAYFGNATNYFKFDGTSTTFRGGLNADDISAGTLTGISIAIGSGNNIFKADANGIYLGNATFASAPFRVTPAGALVATSATITGTVQTDTGGAGHYQRTVIDSSDNTIKMYDENNVMKIYLYAADSYESVLDIGINDAAHHFSELGSGYIQFLRIDNNKPFLIGYKLVAGSPVLRTEIDVYGAAYFASYVNAVGGFKDNGVAGIDKTFSFVDWDNFTHSIVISGGIITQWNVST